MKKTNAMRMLDSHKISYEVLEYPVDESELGAKHVAELVGVPVEQVYKTLVAEGDKTGIIVAVVPGASEVDLKAFASVSGNKKVQMVHMKELLGLTGYIRGGCSPIGMKKPYPVFVDESMLQFEKVYISGGARGVQVHLAVKDLVSFTKAHTGSFIHYEE